MQWISVLLSLFGLGYPGDELSQVTTAANGDILVAGSIAVVEIDDEGFDDGNANEWSQSDTYIARLKSDAQTVVWEKSYGWIKDDHARAIVEYPDGTIQVIGHTWSTGNGFSDAYFMLLDSDGELIWEQDFGGTGVDMMESLVLVQDSVVAVGVSASYGGATQGLPWMMRVSHDGLPLWSTVVGQQDTGRFRDVVRARGGVIAVGEVEVSQDFEETDSAVTHVLVDKFSDNGTLLWQKQHLVGFNPEACAIASVSDGGIMIAGSTHKKPGLARDGFLLKLTSSGAVSWFKLYGGLYHDLFNDIVRLPNNQLIAIGATSGPMFNDIWARGVTKTGATFLNSFFSTEGEPVYGRSLTRLLDGTFAFTGGHLLGKFSVTKP